MLQVNEGFSPYLPFDLVGPWAGVLCAAVLEKTVLVFCLFFSRGSTVFAITMVLQSIKKAGSSDNHKLKVSTTAINSFAGNPGIISVAGRTHNAAASHSGKKLKR